MISPFLVLFAAILPKRTERIFSHNIPTAPVKERPCDEPHPPLRGPPVSLRLGHAAVLTVRRTVIHYRFAASLPPGDAFIERIRSVRLSGVEFLNSMILGNLDTSLYYKSLKGSATRQSLDFLIVLLLMQLADDSAAAADVLEIAQHDGCVEGV